MNKFIVIMILVIPLLGNEKDCNDKYKNLEIIECLDYNLRLSEIALSNNYIRIYNRLSESDKKKLYITENLWRQWIDNHYSKPISQKEYGLEGEISRGIHQIIHIKNHINVLTIMFFNKKIHINNIDNKVGNDNIFLNYKEHICKLALNNEKKICKYLHILENNIKHYDEYSIKTIQETNLYSRPNIKAKILGTLMKNIEIDIIDMKEEYLRNSFRTWIKIKKKNSKGTNTYWVTKKDIIKFEIFDKINLFNIEKTLKQKKDLKTYNKEFFQNLLPEKPIEKKTLTTYNNIAYYLQKAGLNQEAVYLLEKILEKFPKRVVAYYNLGDAYWQLGDKKKAIASYTTYIEQMCNAGKAKKIPEVVKDRVSSK